MPQWHFYSEMVYQDRKVELDRELAITEYLAGFWNPEAVKKVQDVRASASAHKFKDDKEFEENILSGDYKNNKLIDAIKKINELERESNTKLSDSTKKIKSKLPTDLSSIHRIMDKK